MNRTLLKLQHLEIARKNCLNAIDFGARFQIENNN